MSSRKHILRLDASANVNNANSKKLGDLLIQRLQTLYPDAQLQQRDLNQGLSFIDESWLTANLTPLEQRSEAQQQRLAFSDTLIDEIRQADTIVVTTPMYNFGVPATLKSWIDLVCRAGVTFQYTPDGPVGLMKGKRVEIIITTGGVPLGSPVDFASEYLKQVFRFIGIDDINIIAADQMNLDADASFSRAQTLIENRFAGDSAAA